MGRKEIDNLAEQIITRLKAENFTIQRYNAYSTNSIYLKLDYGLCNSIRISDHKGKKNLDYRYNLLSHYKTISTQTSPRGHLRLYYPFSEVDTMLHRILKDREEKVAKYGELGYVTIMNSSKKKNQDAKGFWSKAVLV